MKVLLLNPPASRPVIRDYYCSKSTKSNYLFQPIDLVMQSGVLAEKHDVVAIDAVAKRLSADRCLAEIQRISPGAILGLWGAVTDHDDRIFYEHLAQNIPAPIFITGEIFLHDPGAWLREHPYIKGALLRFVSTGLADYLSTGAPGPDLVINESGEMRGGFDPAPPAEFSLGRPRHELFGSGGYRFSFARGRAFFTVLTDFGCPFKCSFCVMSGLGYRVRPAGEVIEELKWIKGAGVRELFVTDQCFGARRDRALTLCEMMAKEAPGLSFTTFTRADLLDEELLTAMKRAGAHTLIMGVESAEAKTLAAYSKNLSLDKVRAGFGICRRMGIRTVATFVIGLPEDDRESILASMRLARELSPDFVSYNVAVPRAGTALREIARKEGLSVPGVAPDQAGDTVALRTRSLTPAEVGELKRRAIRDFYLRPSYLFRRLTSVESLSDLSAQVREGISLIGKNI